MSVSPLLGDPHYQLIDSNGDPCVNWTMTFVLANTTTPVDTFTDSGGLTANDNPLTFNSYGWPENSGGAATMIYGTNGTAYDIIIKNAAGTTIRTLEDVYPGDSLAADLASTTTDENLGAGTKAFNLVYYGPLTGETNISKYQFPPYPRYDIRRIGANADGSTGDSNNFQNAITNLPTGGILELTPGKSYKIDASFSITKQCTIIARGATLIATALANIGITATANVQWIGGTFDNVWLGWSGSSVTQGGVYGGHFQNQTYSNTTAISNASGVIVERCYFTGQAQGPAGTSHYPCFQVTTGAYNSKFLNNICYQVEQGVTNDGVTAYSNTIEVRGNHFTQLRYYALKMQVANYAIFENNHIDDARYAIFYDNQSTGGTGVTRDSGQQIICHKNTMLNITDAPTLTVAGDEGAYGGLYISGANNPYTRVSYKNNYMNNVTIGVSRSCGHIDIEGNHFYTGQSLYHYFDTAIVASDIKIVGNVIDTTSMPASPSQDSDGLDIGGCIVFGSQATATNWSNQLLVAQNTFIDWDGTAIMLANVTSTLPNIKIRDNKFEPGAASDWCITIGRANQVKIFDNEVEGSVTRIPLLLPDTTHIAATTAPLVERNSWQIVTAVPTDGADIVGELLRNDTPAAAGTIGWVCTTTGGNSAGTRANTTAYAVGDWYTWSSGTTVWECTTAGTTAGSAPSIVGLSYGDTVVDGTVTWTYRHSVAAVWKTYGTIAA